MSIQKFKKAMRLAKRCDDYEKGDGVSKSFLDYSEKQLGITFSPTHRYYLHKYGDICFSGYELFGLAENVPENAPAWGNLLRYTLSERKDNNLPHDWLPILSYDDGAMVYLDYSDMIKKEPKIIIRTYNGSTYINNNESFTDMDLGDFTLFLVEQSL